MVTASFVSKALLSGCLLIVFAASLTLFLIRDKRYVDTLPGLVDGHRNITQIIVQVLSTTLSMAQMLVVCSLINFAARIELFDHSTSIGNISFWAALSTPRFDGTLPKIRLMIVLLALGLGPGLGALWSGSLTPLFTSTSREDGHVLAPFFNAPIFRTMYPLSKNRPGRLAEQCDNADHPAPPDPRGPPYPPLDNCIVIAKVGSLIMTASTATNVTNPYQHPKIDNSTWTYQGRSYGKGSSTGLFNVIRTSINVTDQGYSYNESGYLATASCNQQSDNMFPFQQYYSASDDTEIDLWSADTVVLSSGNISVPPFDVATPAWNLWNSQPFGYFVWTALSENGVHRLITSGNGWSTVLANISCTLDFAPTIFQTNVSTVDRHITITPLETLNEFNQTGNITEAVIGDLDLLSRVSSSSLAYSSLYSAVGTNVASVRLLHPEMTDKQTAEIAMQASIEGIIDDLLTYQGILAVARDDGESIATPVSRHFVAIKFGETKFHIALLVINILLCLAYILEATRTRGWKRLPKFDFVNIKELTLATLGRGHLKDDEKLVAFYETDETPRICYANASSGLEHRSRNSETEQNTFTDEGLSHHLDDLELSQRSEAGLRVQGSGSTSRASLRPLLGESQSMRNLM